MTSILIVDDSAVDRALAGELLGKEPEWEIEQAYCGEDALKRIKESPPDLVVTDLQMPGMGGLDLVTAARDFQSVVPFILMTAHGSEELALEALARGAASYVAKSQLVDVLLPTVKQVLSLARADRSHKRLIECLTATEFTFSLENDLSLINALVDLMQGMVDGVGLCDPLGRLRVGMALEQALHNAIYWGNLEITPDDIEEARERLLLGNAFDLVEQRSSEMPYHGRRVRVRARISPEKAEFVVGDEGPGFNVVAVPGGERADELVSEGGRGLVLMRAFMDEVVFNDAGNEVTMIKRRECAAVAG